MKDLERLDLPSASSFETDVLCPGRQQLLQTLPPYSFEQTPDEEATRGTLIHKARENASSENLSEEDAVIFEQGMKNEREIVSRWQLDFGIRDWDFQEGPRELRLWLNNPETLQPATSAKLDVHYVSGKRVLIVDLKGLWCTNLTPAERNYQGMIQAVVAAKEYDATHVRVAFNKAMLGKSDTVDYGESDLKHAEESIFQHLWEMRQPGAQRRAGLWCRYCPAKSFCPEAGAFSILPSVVNKTPWSDANAPLQMVAQLSPLDLVLIWERSTVIEKILTAVKARLKGFNEDDLKSLGIRKAPGRNLDPIVKTEEAFEALGAFGISEQALWATLSFSKGGLLEAVMRDQNWSKAQTETWLKQMLAPMIEKKRSAEYLEKIK